METLDLHFRIVCNGGYYTVQLLREGQDAIEGPWELNAGPDTQFAQDLNSIDANTCSWDNINFVGGELWLRLTPGDIREALASLRKESRKLWQQQSPQARDFIIRIELPDDPPNDLRALPWESLYSRDISALGFAVRPRYGIVHHPPPEATIADFSPREGSQLSMLILAPQNTQLNVFREIDALSALAASRSVKLQVLSERVTANAVFRALRGQSWDIVHYIGHGAVNERNRLEIMLNDDTGAPTFEDAEALCNSFQTSPPVRLAVFNCCRSSGSTVRPDILSGLGPMLMRMGVPAVVTQRYEIADHMASAFARAFYEALFTGPDAGRVDIAMGEARGALSRDHRGQLRSVITPMLHLAPGYERVFTFAAAAQAQPSIKPAVASVAAASPAPAFIRTRPPFNPGLKEALRAQRCVPVIGPGILSAGIMRGTAPPPGPLELVRQLTAPPRTYPRARDLEFVNASSGSEWVQTLVMQWVCQYHSQQDGGWAKLASEICSLYEKVEAPEVLHRIADLKVPGLFYTWFDGLIHACVQRGRSALSEVITELTPSGMESSSRDRERRPLVLPRGSIHNPGSLVITENDHERLAASIARMPSELRAITRRKFPCSVLFIGLNPREPLVRQLCQVLLDTNTTGRRVQGPTYFLCSSDEVADQAYWAQYETTWLIDDTEPFLEDLLEASS